MIGFVVIQTQSFTISGVAERPRGATDLPLLSHLRWVAALVVVLSHVKQDILGRVVSSHATAPLSSGLVTKAIFRSEGYGHSAVVIFFVLSGFLVGGKLMQLAGSETVRRDWPVFLIDRFTRIFIVLWPTLLLTGVVFACLIWLVPGAPFVHDGNWALDLAMPLTVDHDRLRWAASAALLNELVTPALECNGPLWSLAYEWCYYIIGLMVVLCYRRVGSTSALLTIGYGALLLLISLINQPDIVFSSLSWLAGIAARWSFDRRVFQGRFTQIAGLAAVVMVLALERGHALPDPVLGGVLALMIAHTGWTSWTWGARLGERLAGFSYSLYAMHFPILLAVMGGLFSAGLLQHPLAFNAMGFAVAGTTLVLIVGLARLFAVFTEDQTPRVRRLMMPFMGLRG